MAKRTQPTAGGRLPLESMSRIVLSLIEMFVPSLMISRTTPWKARNAARVTTKDGMPTLATSMPSMRPMTTPVTMAATIATYHGTSWLVSSTARTAAQTPLA